MKDTDILLSRAEKLRRDARSVRRDAVRLSGASDQDRMRQVAATLEADARDQKAGHGGESIGGKLQGRFPGPGRPC